MSNSNLKRVFEKLLKNEKSGYILCLVSKGSQEISTEEQISRSDDPKLFKESYKKPLFAMGCRKRKKATNQQGQTKKVEVDLELKQIELMEKSRERYFAGLATKGVIQLFNAITSHQKEIDAKLNEVGKSETRKEKVISSITKNSFIQRLNSKPAKKTFTIEASL